MWAAPSFLLRTRALRVFGPATLLGSRPGASTGPSGDLGCLPVLCQLQSQLSQFWTSFANFWMNAPGTVGNDWNTFIQDIWNSIVPYLTNFLVAIVQEILGGVTAAVQDLLNFLLSTVTSITNAIIGALAWLSNSVVSVSSSAGPFAPIIAVLFFGTLLVGGILLVYVVTVVFFAVGKTGFNLL